MKERYNPIIQANRDQFLSTYHMLKKVVAICPEEVWRESYHGYPFWYHVYHSVFYIDYWFREEYSNEFEPLLDVEKEIPPDMERDLPEHLIISKKDMVQFLNLLERKILKFFDGITDVDLGHPILPGEEQFTYMDIIIGQNRHVMYNMGYLNGILRSLYLPESEWWAYNETEE